jgi:Tfp pilus assembly protein PilF
MRYSTVAVAVSLALLSVSASLSGQKPVASIDGQSLELLAQAKAARAAGNLEGATDLLETAVAVDPRNRQAFVLMAEMAQARGLPGKAIRLYREALVLDPGDVQALQGQGAALVQKGAVTQARANLAKIRQLCRTACAPATQLSAVIAKGPPITTAQAVPPKRPTADE